MSSNSSSTFMDLSEVAKHNKPNDLWVVIHGNVWDLTKFVKEHPGGSKVIMDVAGKDGTKAFSMIHPKDLVEKVLDPKTALIGKVAPTANVDKSNNQGQEANEMRLALPGLHTMLNLFDFESIAGMVMNNEGWGYYSSGADDEITLRENRAAFSRIWLKPRILVDVSKIDMNTKFCDAESSIPLYISATALGKLAHPDGELAITKAAFKSGIPYMLPTLSSYSLDEMLEARAPAQKLFSQLYVNTVRDKSKEYVEKLIKAGIRALFVTVDAPQLGRREKDMRNKMKTEGTDVQKGDSSVDKSQGVTRAISSFIDPSFSWRDIPWIKSIVGNSGTKIYLKGVQCGEDAVLALRAGLSGVVLSNHGGRQLDLSRSGIEILPEVMQALKQEPNYRRENFEVFVDGGIRRGADIFKAIALGASAVGIGRPVLYSLAGYGQEGIERMIKILKDELEMCMRLMGTPTIKDITEKHVITKNLSDHITVQPTDYLADKTYERLRTQREIMNQPSKL